MIKHSAAILLFGTSLFIQQSSMVSAFAQSAGEVPGTSVKQPAPAETVGAPPAAMVQEERPKLALSLGGGGARGVAHIGVLKVLTRAGIKPDLVTGSSVGAVIGALYCAGVSPDEIERLALNGDLKWGLLPSGLKWQATKTIPRYALLRLLGRHPAIGLYNGKRIAQFVEKNVPAGTTRLEDLKIPLAVVATNVLDTRPVWITKGDLGQAVRASASIPYIIQPTSFDGKLLIDGGMRANLPTKPAVQAGAQNVIAVRLHSSLDAQPAGRFKNFIDYSDRILSILMSEIEQKSVGEADIVIEPQIDNVNTYSFKRADLAKMIAAGEAAAQKALPAIQQRLNSTKSASTGSHL